MVCQCGHKVRLGLMKLFMFEIAFNRTVPLLMHKPSFHLVHIIPGPCCNTIIARGLPRLMFCKPEIFRSYSQICRTSVFVRNIRTGKGFTPFFFLPLP